MSYAFSSPSSAQRSGLLGVVIGLHAAVLLAVMAARTVIPEIVEMPLVVDLLQPPTDIRQPIAKPPAIAKPQPVRQPVPKTPTPVIEATRSEQPAPAALVASPPDIKPAPPAPPAGEPVSQARFDADYLNNPAPPYPPLSRKIGEEGKVILRVSVTPQGGADSVEIKTSSGSQRLDDSAQRTVRNWKFIPAKRGDSAVQSWVLVPIIFKLES